MREYIKRGRIVGNVAECTFCDRFGTEHPIHQRRIRRRRSGISSGSSSRIRYELVKERGADSLGTQTMDLYTLTIVVVLVPTVLLTTTTTTTVRNGQMFRKRNHPGFTHTITGITDLC